MPELVIHDLLLIRGEDTLVQAILLSPRHVLHLQPVSAEMEEEDVALRGSLHQLPAAPQDVPPRRYPVARALLGHDYDVCLRKALGQEELLEGFNVSGASAQLVGLSGVVDPYQQCSSGAGRGNLLAIVCTAADCSPDCLSCGPTPKAGNAGAAGLTPNP
eukprot:CAMPEP_0184326546 /NCGR_PEP_ID=MMETSP1049-20130417/142613_1 /TAXON_ID=77928 /ORGANISM="Proteomonas sulcata, Strain CCMP704" /LENGTH=159 /DNA_ID=CAMNT_0026648749 /DNA_START=1147 /DNA_END=1623 /DNA_ORIENTATION=+